MCIDVLFACIIVHHVNLVPTEARQKLSDLLELELGTVVSHHTESNLGPLEEQSSTEPALLAQRFYGGWCWASLSIRPTFLEKDSPLHPLLVLLVQGQAWHPKVAIAMNFESWLHGWEAHMFDTVAVMLLGASIRTKQTQGRRQSIQSNLGLKMQYQQFTVWRQLKLIWIKNDIIWNLEPLLV